MCYLMTWGCGKVRSESGWIDSELFLVWLKKVFLKHVVSQRPILLLIDGHKSHITLEAVDICRDSDIILFMPYNR